jgi:dihydroorotate dehydrogenase (fumarate)
MTTSPPRGRDAVTAGVQLSSRAEARLPRSWIALLRHRVKASLAATTGVEASDDVAAYLQAGADIVMTASALLRNGPEHTQVPLDGLTTWMDRKGFTAVGRVRPGLLSTLGDGTFGPVRRQRGV